MFGMSKMDDARKKKVEKRITALVSVDLKLMIAKKLEDSEEQNIKSFKVSEKTIETAKKRCKKIVI